MIIFFKKKIFNKYKKKKTFKFKKFKHLKKYTVYKKKHFKKRIYFLKKKRKKLNRSYKTFGLFSYSIFYKISNIITRVEKKKLKKKKNLKLTNNILPENSTINVTLPNNSITSVSLPIPIIKKKAPKFILLFNLKINNVFINLIKYQKKKKVLVKFWSAGVLDINCSKKKIKFGITTLMKILKKKLKRLRLYAIKIKGPKYYIKVLYRCLKRFSFRPRYIIFSSFKIFNGCRSRKAKRKKHLKFQYFR